jgi:hypothetical protein
MFLKKLWEEKRLKKAFEASPGPNDYQKPLSKNVSTFLGEKGRECYSFPKSNRGMYLTNN